MESLDIFSAINLYVVVTDNSRNNWGGGGGEGGGFNSVLKYVKKNVLENYEEIWGLMGENMSL